MPIGRPGPVLIDITKDAQFGKLEFSYSPYVEKVKGTSLVSEPNANLIADSIETVMSAQWYDGCIAIPGCDKNMPGSMIAIGRLNRPALMIYGGTIKPGCLNQQPIDIVSAFQSYGQYLVGDIKDEERKQIVQQACPSAGTCGGMYTANTMACAIEALGMTVKDLSPNQKVVHSLDQPIKQTGHIRILKGNLAPEGAVAKITGKEGLFFEGPAKVFDSEGSMVEALEEHDQCQFN